MHEATCHWLLHLLHQLDTIAVDPLKRMNELTRESYVYN